MRSHTVPLVTALTLMVAACTGLPSALLPGGSTSQTATGRSATVTLVGRITLPPGFATKAVDKAFDVEAFGRDGKSHGRVGADFDGTYVIPGAPTGQRMRVQAVYIAKPGVTLETLVDTPAEAGIKQAPISAKTTAVAYLIREAETAQSPTRSIPPDTYVTAPELQRAVTGVENALATVITNNQVSDAPGLDRAETVLSALATARREAEGALGQRPDLAKQPSGGASPGSATPKPSATAWVPEKRPSPSASSSSSPGPLSSASPALTASPSPSPSVTASPSPSPSVTASPSPSPSAAFLNVIETPFHSYHVLKRLFPGTALTSWTVLHLGVLTGPFLELSVPVTVGQQLGISGLRDGPYGHLEYTGERVACEITAASSSELTLLIFNPENGTLYPPVTFTRTNNALDLESRTVSPAATRPAHAEVIWR